MSSLHSSILSPYSQHGCILPPHSWMRMCGTWSGMLKINILKMPFNFFCLSILSPHSWMRMWDTVQRVKKSTFKGVFNFLRLLILPLRSWTGMCGTVWHVKNQHFKDAFLTPFVCRFSHLTVGRGRVGHGLWRGGQRG